VQNRGTVKEKGSNEDTKLHQKCEWPIRTVVLLLLKSFILQ